MHFLFMDKKIIQKVLSLKSSFGFFLFFNAFSLPDNIHGSCPRFEEICAFIYLYI